jgi:hypothetical protein
VAKPNNTFEKGELPMDIVFIAHVVVTVGYALMVVGFFCR